MPLPERLRRSHDQSSIGWISNTDAVMFGMVVFFVVAVWLEQKNDPAYMRELGDTKERLRDTLDELETAQVSIAKWQRDAETAAKRLEEVLVESTALQATIADLQRKNEELNKNNDTLAESVESLERRLKKGSEGYQNLRLAFHELRDQYEAEIKSHKDDLTKLAALAEKAADVQRQVQAVHQENSVILAAYFELLPEVVRLRSDEGGVRRELIGLKGKDGKLRRVAILFDASFSMKQGGRWDKARSVMEVWLKYLDIDAGALVVFNTDVKVFPANGTLLLFSGAGTSNRDKLCQFLAAVEPVGGTNTLAALQRAYSYPDLDAILLFTDGAPNDGRGAVFDPKVAEKIYVLCQSHRDVPINAVGLGDYFKPDLSHFLLKIAEITGGTFLGR